MIDQMAGNLWDMPLSIIRLSLALFAYPILAIQLAAGFPPFYTSILHPSDDGFKDFCRSLFPFVIGFMLVGGFIASTEIRGPIVLFGVGALVVGLHVRRRVSKNTNGPLGLYLTSLSWGRPMLVFDLWSIGITALICALVVFN